MMRMLLQQRLLRMDPCFLFMDTTYKTNWYNLPLLDMAARYQTRHPMLALQFVSNEKAPSDKR
jgi:hypothetical protein